ncbi:MAG: hypothetical protein R2705_19260 [Ilumatobacteraceae bacterium]
MPKITLVGAGSTVFAKSLLGDILSLPALAGSEISLYDIDPERLHTSEIVAHKTATAVGATPKISATTDRRSALEAADHVITMFQIGGYEPSTVVDFEVPKKYGLRQTIADTLGVGGIMRSLRTVPVLLDVCADMEELCGDATLLQYVNPMSINCWAINRATTIRTVGLCHSVQHTAAQLAGRSRRSRRRTRVPLRRDQPPRLLPPIRPSNRRRFRGPAAGDRRVRGHGVDPESWQHEALRRRRHRTAGRGPVRGVPAPRLLRDRVERALRRVRPVVHQAGPPDLIERFGIPLDEYPARCEVQLAGWERLRARMEDPESELRVRPSVEYGAPIIHAIETGRPQVVYGNVMNDGLITNLPQDCCVEVPCLVDHNGVQPVRIGRIPPQLAALMQTNVNVQSLTVEALLTGNREHVYHAAMFDPHTAAELDLDQIWRLVDELLESHGEFIPASLRA